MSFRTTDGVRHSNRIASSRIAGNQAILEQLNPLARHEELEDISGTTTISPVLLTSTRPATTDKAVDNIEPGDNQSIPSARSTAVSNDPPPSSTSSRRNRGDPPSIQDRQQGTLRSVRRTNPYDHESIPDSITTTGTLIDQHRSHLNTRIDDLTSRVLAINDLQASVEAINKRLDQTDTDTANVMLGIQQILKTINQPLPPVQENQATSTDLLDLTNLPTSPAQLPASSAPTTATPNAPPAPTTATLVAPTTTPAAPATSTNPTAQTTATSVTATPVAPPANITTTPYAPPNTTVPSATLQLPTSVPSVPPTPVTNIQSPTTMPVAPPAPPTPPYSLATHESFASTPVQQPPPNTFNQPTIPFLFQQQPGHKNAAGQTVIVQQSTNHIRKFDEFKPQKGDTYTYWKNFIILPATYRFRSILQDHDIV